MRRWRLFSIGPTSVMLHPALLIYGLYALVTGHFQFMALATVSIIVHEASHALASTLFKKPPSCIELTPLGAVMRMEDDEALSPLKRLIVLAAGPASTLVLCWCAVKGTQSAILSVSTGRLLFLSNLSILLLNLFPVLPLDGGRLLALLLGRFLPQHVVSRTMRILGSAIGIGLIILNIACSWKLGGWNLSLAFAGCCMLYSAGVSTTSYAMAELRGFLERKIRLERQGSSKTLCVTCLHTEKIRTLARKLPPGRCVLYLCLEAGSMRPLGWLTEFDLIQHYLQQPESTLKECIKRSFAGSPDINLAQSEDYHR